MLKVDLGVRTRALALSIIKLYAKLPKEMVAQVVGKQILRSGTSIGAHYCEAKRSRSTAEFVAKVELAVQELEESIYWLHLLGDAEIIPVDHLQPLHQELKELVAIFTASSKKAKQNSKD
jgi:four helix bundle protein